TLSASIPTALDPSLAASYQYARFWPTLGVGVTRAATTEYDYSVAGVQQPYRRHTVTASGSVTLPVLRRAESSSNLSLSYVYRDYGPADPFPIADPFSEATHPPEMGPNTNFNIDWA